jgi:hypothetical protein
LTNYLGNLVDTGRDMPGDQLYFYCAHLVLMLRRNLTLLGQALTSQGLRP